MLQQILREMYIEPDLLDELSEDQKQILFCKMREEQVRRWKVREEEEENKPPEKTKKSFKHGKGSNKKQTSFLKGSDGKDWVWVMGEHKDDKSIEQILEEEAQERAIKQAEKEAEELRRKEEMELKKALQEEEKLAENNKDKEAENKRKEDEAEMIKSLKEAHIAVQKREKDKKSVKKRHHEDEKMKSLKKIDEIKTRRSSEIYFHWKQNRNTLQKDAEKSSQILEEEWREQEKRVKETERKMREIARRAREEHRKSLSGSVKVIGAANAFKSYIHKKGPAPPIPEGRPSKAPKDKSAEENEHHPLPPRPRNRNSVIKWFRKYEVPKATGLDPQTKKPAQWFHGLIGRAEAEGLLKEKKAGTFLVRVSERIWGYTISYRSEDRCKHFLIDKSDDNYHFFGSNQLEHTTLNDMITYHSHTPISTEEELLKHPCGQQVDPPDYCDLFHDGRSESTTL
ncbi:SH2 domain-containing protein 4B-like [Liolophura sinensis]|uniref:SH2 domain-containing protein 4B-like n=1 Tax=Liolophura sinensis TaxID=3198878 RepID=UPI003158BC93